MNRFRAALACLVLLLPAMAEAREQIRIVGSSTVFPFVAAAAEKFGYDGKFRTPIVESTGTGGGFKMFCDGIGERYPDMSNASRALKESERKQCEAHGITAITELALGYDGIVLANAKQSPNFTLTRRVIFLALARDIPKNGKLVPNYYERWNEIDPKLPDLPIVFYGRPPSSGTRDAFSELVMEAGCHQVPEMRALSRDEEAYKHRCTALREDGAYIEAGDDNNLIVQKLINNPDALGMFGYNFLDTNASLIKANAVDGVMPREQAIIDGSYPVARLLFTYIKNAQLGHTPGLKAFAAELTSDGATGPDGYLVLKGLIPLPAAQHEAMKKVAAGLE